MSRLKTEAENLRIVQLLAQERFREREEEIKTKGSKAEERQRHMSEGFHKTLEEYLSLIDSLPPDGAITQADLETISVFLDRIMHQKRRPLLGTLPYTHLNYPAREPNQDPPITPAYRGGNKTVAPDDLANTEEAPISGEIATLAQTLNWNPVTIYEYVKNNIETEWYWGCMKGAEETLRQGSGNDCDQAALLVALLRASGFPSRYVRGTIEFFAGRDEPTGKVKNLFGIEDPWKTAELLQKAGIPYSPVIEGGTISNFQVEHIWVESRIPYANYRGAVIDDRGKTWLGLDTSIKVKDYRYNTPADILQEFALSGITDEYLGSVQTMTPMEYTKKKIEDYLTQNHSDKIYTDFLSSRSLTPETMNIIPASMQFKQIQVTHEYTYIPDALKHKVKFAAADRNNRELFKITIDTMNLSNKPVVLTYEPETVEDQQIINAYGGLDNTPAYLVKLRPVLKINGERVVIAEDGLLMGADYNLTMELLSPNETEKITSAHIAGNLSVIGIAAQKTGSNQLFTISENDNAEEIFFKETQNYMNRWNRAEDELASLMHLVKVRPLPTVVTVGGVIDVTWLLDIPHGYEWKGVYVDSNLRSIEAVGAYGDTSSTIELQNIFMQLSALQGSVLEHKIFEDDFQVDSISTAKLLEIANSTQIPLQTIDKTNSNTVLPALPFDDNVKEDIKNAVNQELTVKIPDQEMAYQNWTGMGYLKENTGTKEAGYMLSGMIAGGMTAVSPDAWSNQYLVYKLRNSKQDGYKTVIITSPQTGTIVTTSLITVSGIITDKNARVTVNGTEAMVDGNTFTAAGISLQQGMNLITAIAENSEGKKTTDAINVRYEIPVAVYITFPYDGSDIAVTPIDAEGIVSDPSAAVDINGISATVSGDGRFIARGINLSEGINPFTAEAMNMDGNSGSHTIYVNYIAAQVNPILISITSPVSNAAIYRPAITVRGTVTSEAQEVSIKVNGVLAEKYGNQFIANGVPLTDGNNAIIVNALDSNGAVGRAETTVIAVTTEPYITLGSNITSGIPPLTAYFSVSTEIPNPIVQYEMDFEGDGTIDYSGITFEDIGHAYTTEGIYYPTLMVTDDQGNTYSDTIAITVFNKALIDALLKAKWEGMKAALAEGNIEGALKCFIGRSKERYGIIFSALKDQFPAILQTFVEFNIVNVFENIAEYEIVANENGDLYSYPGIFVRDGDGIWRFKDF